MALTVDVGKMELEIFGEIANRFAEVELWIEDEYLKEDKTEDILEVVIVRGSVLAAYNPVRMHDPKFDKCGFPNNGVLDKSH